jgi:hypothetical protein
MRPVGVPTELELADFNQIMYEHNATAGQPQVRTYEFPTITNNALE